MDEPTQEQAEGLWEWSGLCIHDWDESGYGLVGDTTCKKCGISNLFNVDPDGKSWSILPSNPYVLNLNNLFEHVVPKAITKIMSQLHVGEPSAYRYLFDQWYEKLMLGMERPNSLMVVVYPALALFWVLWQIKEVKE